MNKVFAVIGGQVFISQAVVEQAANAISKAVVMDCGTGELKLVDAPPSDVAEWLEKITSQLTMSPLGAQLRADVEEGPEIADPGLLELIRKAAEEGAKAGYRTALEDLKQGEDRSAVPQIKIAATPEGMLYVAGIGMGVDMAEQIKTLRQDQRSLQTQVNSLQAALAALQ